MQQIKKLAAATLLALPLTPAWPAATPAALEQAAIVSPKALTASMLALTNAGTRLIAVGERGTILWSDNAGAQSWGRRLQLTMSSTVGNDDQVNRLIILKKPPKPPKLN